MTDEKKTVARESYNIVDTVVADWEHLDLQLDELLEEEDWESIAAYVSDNERLLFQKWASNGREHLDRALRVGNFSMTITADMLSMDAKINAVFSIGTLWGMLQLLGKQVSYEKEELYSVQIAEKALSSVKNLDEIVLLLEQNGTLTHSALAKKLGGMNLPTLTDNMRKVTDRGLAYSQIYGRYKQYYLTDTGRAYARNLRKRRNTDMNLENIENLIEDWLNDSTKAKSVQEMLERLCTPKKDTKHEEFLRTVLQESEDLKQEALQLSERHGIRERDISRAQTRHELLQSLEDALASFEKPRTRLVGAEALRRKNSPVHYPYIGQSRSEERTLDTYVAAFQEQGRSGIRMKPDSSTPKVDMACFLKKMSPCFISS